MDRLSIQFCSTVGTRLQTIHLGATGFTMLIACEFPMEFNSFLLFRDPRWRQIPEWPNRQVTASATSAELPRISERRATGLLQGRAPNDLVRASRRAPWGRFWRRDSTRRAGAPGSVLGAFTAARQPAIAGRVRDPRHAGPASRSRGGAAATGPTDEGRLRLDRSGSNTGVNANVPKRGDGVSAVGSFGGFKSKDGEDIFVDASRSRRNSQPEAPLLSSPVQVQKPTGSLPTALPRAAVAGGIVAETAGQLAESTLMSERERLQLDQKRQRCRARRRGSTDRDVLKETAERALDTLQAEISALGSSRPS